jgi:hypothetical protein
METPKPERAASDSIMSTADAALCLKRSHLICIHCWEKWFEYFNGIVNFYYKSGMDPQIRVSRLKGEITSVGEITSIISKMYISRMRIEK